MAKIRSYSELRRLRTFEERFEYLALKGYVGGSTFGFDRWVNQHFYKSAEWRNLRNHIIVRDNGCDLGIEGFNINFNLIVHHMNPLTMNEITDGGEYLLDPNYLITTSLLTHNAIHFGNKKMLPRGPVERKPNDTKLW